MIDEIKTERLILRPVRDSDAEAIVAGVGDFEVARWLTHAPHPYGPKDAQEFIDKNREQFPDVVAIEMDSRLAGLSGVRGELGLGYWICKDMWGKGIAVETSRALLDWYFENTTGDTVVSGYLLGNARSRKILEILGFSNTHIEPVTPMSTGVETEVQKMSLSRARWQAKG